MPDAREENGTDVRRITNEYMEVFVKMWIASNPSEAATHWQTRALRAEQELERLATDHAGAVDRIAVLELALRDMADDCWPDGESTTRRYIEGAETAIARAGGSRDA